MNRAEHLAWAKQRALEYLDRGDAPNAIASMLSDLNKHDELPKEQRTQVRIVSMMTDHLRPWIEGFE